MSKNSDAELSVQAMKNAINNQNPDTKEIIIHRDLGSKYTSNKLKNYIKVLSIKHSYRKRDILMIMLQWNPFIPALKSKMRK